jgi:hypothetical protein
VGSVKRFLFVLLALALEFVQILPSLLLVLLVVVVTLLAIFGPPKIRRRAMEVLRLIWR